MYLCTRVAVYGSRFALTALSRRTSSATLADILAVFAIRFAALAFSSFPNDVSFFPLKSTFSFEFWFYLKPFFSSFPEHWLCWSPCEKTLKLLLEVTFSFSLSFSTGLPRGRTLNWIGWNILSSTVLCTEKMNTYFAIRLWYIIYCC